MESFYTQLLTVLVLIVAALIYVLVYRKITELMKSVYKNENRDATEKDSQPHYKKPIHPRVFEDAESQSTEVTNSD